ncbi:MAG: hypothetical protein ACOX71_01975 [Lachnospiraceae bacterium]
MQIQELCGHHRRSRHICPACTKDFYRVRHSSFY